MQHLPANGIHSSAGALLFQVRFELRRLSASCMRLEWCIGNVHNCDAIHYHAPGLLCSYHVVVTNESNDVVQLRHRHWVIRDANGKKEEVRCGTTVRLHFM